MMKGGIVMKIEEKNKFALMLQNDLTTEQKAELFDLLCGKNFGRGGTEMEAQFIFDVKQAMDMRNYKVL